MGFSPGPVKPRMIGEIQQFNELLEASKDTLARRDSHKQTATASRRIGMHQRQQDPLGAIAMSQAELTANQETKALALQQKKNGLTQP